MYEDIKNNLQQLLCEAELVAMTTEQRRTYLTEQHFIITTHTSLKKMDKAKFQSLNLFTSFIPVRYEFSKYTTLLNLPLSRSTKQRTNKHNLTLLHTTTTLASNSRQENSATQQWQKARQKRRYCTDAYFGYRCHLWHLSRQYAHYEVDYMVSKVDWGDTAFVFTQPHPWPVTRLQ